MLKDLFRKPKYVTVKPRLEEGREETAKPKEQEAVPAKRDMPGGLWQKCRSCGEIAYTKELERNLKVCPKCGYHFRLTARERLAFTVDEGSFVELDPGLFSGNPLDFPEYGEKLAEARDATGLKEAIITGEATIGGFPVIIGVMDSHFIMASMGSAVGEKIVRAMERALERRVPVIIFAASGGARMQEGIISLMQMAKTSGAVAKLGEAGIPYISVFTDPTTGGVTASFASVGDINLAEPGALIAFAGPRVIEQTIRQKLPEGFQRAEFMLNHGFVDLVVPRGGLKGTLAALLDLHQPREGTNA
ncbi:MAG: acetyl-CoA carboxylase, carboxyltransferase subunit beta [Clostridia bacterium]|nr:acetyl-CoA carboxylase, carboxyltransferase subunit beta [Clostridia bacterium]